MYLEPDMSYQSVVTLNEEAEAKMKEEREERKQLRAQNKQNEESAFSFLLRVSIIYMLMRFIISRNSLTRQERYRAWAQQQQQRIDEEEGHRGLTRQEIEQLPLRTVTDETDDLVRNNEFCPICLEAFTVGHQVRTIPCFHSFHQACIDDWLHHKALCPVCKNTAIVSA